MVVRLKLKGIDGGLYKRWRMWFNLSLCEEFYPGLDMFRNSLEREECFLESLYIGAVWLLLARVVRCWVKFFNE